MLQSLKLAGSVLTALAAAASAGTEALSETNTIQRRTAGYYGDVNCNGTVEAADAVCLSAYLFEQETLPPDSMLFSDLDRSGSITSADLTLLKRMLMDGTEPLEVYQFSEINTELIPAPIAAIEPSLPSTGEVSVLMVSVSFPDCEHDEQMTTEEIQELAFSEADKKSHIYPLESITGYYDRASDGLLHLTGDVYEVTADKSIDFYEDKRDILAGEVLTALDSQVNFRKYDANGDSVLDTLMLVLPGSADEDLWWPCSGKSSLMQSFDGVTLGNLCVGGWSYKDASGFVSTWVHELGHALGLPDYYMYQDTQNGGVIDPDHYYGLNGKAGTEMMDDAFGDFCAFSKLMLGWYKPEQVQIYTGGKQTFTLHSSQQSPGCILIPRNDADDFLCEYFLIESVTDEENNKAGYFRNNRFTLFEKGGIRIMHCDASVIDGHWGPELKWNNFGKLYDKSSEKQRVLRLVNDGGGFFRKGAVIDSSTPGFRWYSSSGKLSVEPDVTVTIGDTASDGTCEITVEPAPETESDD